LNPCIFHMNVQGGKGQKQLKQTNDLHIQLDIIQILHRFIPKLWDPTIKIPPQISDGYQVWYLVLISRHLPKAIVH
jgi:hypothetical protein